MCVTTTISPGTSISHRPWVSISQGPALPLGKLCKGVPETHFLCFCSVFAKVCRSMWASVFGSERANVFICKGKCFCGCAEGIK